MKHGVKILVVDDEALVRRSIAMLLKHDGHEVWPAESGDAALAHMAQHRFDLVITDFSMPGMHGDQLVTRIRQLVPGQPIIMATAFVEEYKVFGQASEPVDALLLKPFSLQELRAAVALALARVPPAQPGALPAVPGPSPAPGFIPPRES